ncbi:hypothetical protein HDU87_001109 [Geranomyces variabilis]|uniref:Uncharacterized protein n=1 Tax=Geranomyces variabilis TaxID=109894 RepID=A0AAD5TMZ0_9FUNG|nr:hypothetical protein HDU87_001109 [Geranomyces variabilis]
MDVAAATCLQNPGVQQYVQSAAQDAAAAGFQTGLDSYAGPGLVIGACAPVVLFSALISAVRIRHKSNHRSTLLLLASAANVGDVLNIMYGRTTNPNKLHVRAHYLLLVVFGITKLGLLLCAASYRFSVVLTNTQSRRWIVYPMNTFAVVWTILMVLLGFNDIFTTNRVSRLFWGLATAYPALYIFVAIFVFTLSLQRTEHSIREAAPPTFVRRLMYLRTSNNVLIAVAIACAITLACVTQSLDSTVNLYVLPAQVLLGALWLLAENAFELLTIWQVSLTLDLRHQFLQEQQQQQLGQQHLRQQQQQQRRGGGGGTTPGAAYTHLESSSPTSAPPGSSSSKTMMTTTTPTTTTTPMSPGATACSPPRGGRGLDLDMDMAHSPPRLMQHLHPRRQLRMPGLEDDEEEHTVDFEGGSG